MNQDPARKLLERYEAGESLTDDELSILQRQLAQDPALIRDAQDQRVVNGLLQLLVTNAADDERFVEKCLQRMSEPAVPQPDGATGIELDTSLGTAIESVSRRGRHSSKTATPRRSEFAQIWWIGLAMALLLAVGTWGIYHALQPDVPQQEIAKTPQTQIEPEMPEKIVEIVDSNVPNDPQTAPVEPTPDPVVDQKRSEQIVDTEIKNERPNPANRRPRNTIVRKLDAAPKPEARSAARLSANAPEKNTDTVEPAFATLDRSKDAIWDGNPPAKRFGRGEFLLIKGSARFEMDNGVVLETIGPAELELISNESIYLRHGNYTLEIPRSVDSLAISTPWASLQQPVNARLQLIVDPDKGLETLVTRGQINLFASPEGEQADSTELAKNQLYQSVVRPVPERMAISPVSMARGKNAFVGQIGTGENAVRMNSPLVFANVLERVSAPDVADPQTAFAIKNWPEFARQFQFLQARSDAQGLKSLLNEFFDQKNSDDPIGGSSSFQGTLSINGVEQRFNSREAYERAKQQMFNTLVPQGDRTLNPSAAPNAMSDFSGVINVNGHQLEFTSPEAFRAIKQQMNR